MLKTAISIVQKAFKNKVDKAGKPYMGHLERVVKNLTEPSEELQCIAFLHDLLEDCPEWNQDKLAEFFPKTVVDAVVCLTHQQNQTYDDYISQILTNKNAILVKKADLKDNMDISRLNALTEKDLERLKKYQQAFQRLLNV